MRSLSLVRLVIVVVFVAVRSTPALAGDPLSLSRGDAVSVPDDALELLFENPTDGRPALDELRGRRVFWAQLTVIADRDASDRWVLFPDRGWKRVTLFDDAGSTPVETGVDVPLRDRAIREGTPALPLTVAPGESRTFLLRFEGDLDGWQPPNAFVREVMSESRAQERAQVGQLILGLYAGLLFAVTFLNLLFGRILRDRVYIAYVLYAIPYALIWLARDWLGTELLWPGSPWLDNAVLFVAITAAIVMGNRFAICFLDLKRESPLLCRVLYGIDGAVGVAVVLALTGTWRPVDDLLGAAAMATCVTYLAAGGLSAARGRRPGRFFLLATGVMAVGTIIYTLAWFRVLPITPTTAYAAQLGSAAEMLLLAFALADRVRIAERERRSAEARLLQGVEVNRRLETLSLTDPLTGVANRRRFETAIVDECRRAARDGTPLSVLLADVDFFKAFNDEYGHLAGDGCLRHVARVLAGGVRRGGDLLARYGGEEFVMILPGMTEDAAMTYADGLRRAVADIGLEHPRSTVASHITISIGVAGMDPTRDAVDPLMLIARADDAMYRAKRAGRDQTVRATPIVIPPIDPPAPPAITAP